MQIVGHTLSFPFPFRRNNQAVLSSAKVAPKLPHRGHGSIVQAYVDKEKIAQLGVHVRNSGQSGTVEHCQAILKILELIARQSGYFDYLATMQRMRLGDSIKPLFNFLDTADISEAWRFFGQKLDGSLLNSVSKLGDVEPQFEKTLLESRVISPSTREAFRSRNSYSSSI